MKLNDNRPDILFHILPLFHVPYIEWFTLILAVSVTISMNKEGLLDSLDYRVSLLYGLVDPSEHLSQFAIKICDSI
jgi:hypothetical protein